MSKEERSKMKKVDEVLEDFIRRCNNEESVKSVVSFSAYCSITKHIKPRETVYEVNGNKWHVFDTPFYKYTYCENHSYHCFFSKVTGFTCRISDNINSKDPAYCELGPEILDLEISVNGCPTVGGKNCRFCYKNNTNKPATNMSFETFKKIVDTMPKCLYSIAFGITGVQTNPDFPKMMAYCRKNDIIPNYTLSGADLDEDMLRESCRLCGAVAVSCYSDNKELCYNTIKRFHDCNNLMHINMHIVLSEEEEQLKHIWNVLKDIKEGKVVGLRNIVFLRIKPVGRASKLNCKIHLDTYEEILTYCFENHIGFGFDSCSAPDVAKVLKDMNHEEILKYIEPCESTRTSFYINCHGIASPCSFCEHIKEWVDANVDVTKCIDCNDFIKNIWHNPVFDKFRFPCENNQDKELECFKCYYYF